MKNFKRNNSVSRKRAMKDFKRNNCVSRKRAMKDIKRNTLPHLSIQISLNWFCKRLKVNIPSLTINMLLLLRLSN